MYLLNRVSFLTTIYIRGIYLTKTKTKTNKKQTLIFLRSPKHFNIGKRKVISFNNKHNIKINLNMFIPTRSSKLNFYYFSLISSLFKFDTTYRINSLRIKTKSAIIW